MYMWLEDIFFYLFHGLSGLSLEQNYRDVTGRLHVLQISAHKFCSYVFKVNSDNWYLDIIMSLGSIPWFAVLIEYNQDFSCGWVIW